MGLKAFLMYDIGLQRLSYAIKRKKFIEKYYSASDVSDNKEVKKQIVYMADGRISPGGLGDRIHGLISLYKSVRKMVLSLRPIFVLHSDCMIILLLMSIIGM